MEAEKKFSEKQFKEAQDICNDILEDEPENMQALDILAGTYVLTGNMDEAIKILEKLCSLDPEQGSFHNKISYAYDIKGEKHKSMMASCNAVLSEPNNISYKIDFCNKVRHFRFTALSDETNYIKMAMVICLNDSNISHDIISNSWCSLFLLYNAELVSLVENSEAQPDPKQIDLTKYSPLLNDQFFLLGLRRLIILDIKYEKLMTLIRHGLLLRACGEGQLNEFLPFLCALAEQCFMNEYVYICSAEEDGLIDGLVDKINKDFASSTFDIAVITLMGCYRALDKLECAAAIGEASATLDNSDFTGVIKIQIQEHAKIRDIGKTIETLQPIEDDVSQEVRSQYEENPFPRWRSMYVPHLSGNQKTIGIGKNILVAGCGTGKELLNTAVHFPGAKITGLDLSIPSLAYGKYKALSLGIENVEFMHADILDAEKLEQKFDMIICGGVLHHMKDPVAGWKKLLACLKDDGAMRIALYSEIARQYVVECKKWIEKKGFEATTEGIHAFRLSVMEGEAPDSLMKIAGMRDFYTMSQCRDMAFNVCEHRFTLLQIKEILNDLNLQMVALDIDNPEYVSQYRSLFPHDQEMRSLDNWHEIEKRNNDMFRSMYQFWCMKNSSGVPATMPSWINVAK
jgi:2-polyprenyl-3-methyl-5-hydroxy-6-metoxy-1,4-benzoquinol methylase